MESLAFAFPVTPGKAKEWRYWGREILGARRREYIAFRRRVGLTAHRVYFQHTPQGGLAIFYMEADDLDLVFQYLRSAQDSFAVWIRQRARELLNGLNLTQISLESLSVLAFDGPSIKEDEARNRTPEMNP